MDERGSLCAAQLSEVAVGSGADGSCFPSNNREGRPVDPGAQLSVRGSPPGCRIAFN